MRKHKQIAMLIGAAMSLGILAADDPGRACPDREVVIEIGAVSFTRADLDARAPALLFQARKSQYDAERKAVEQFVEDYLIERQAKAEGVSVAELLKRHVDGAVQQDPSEEALRVYYEGLDTKEPYEAVRGKILEVLHQRRLARARAAYVQSLRAQSAVALRLLPPRAVISVKDTPMRGAPSAPVVLIEYADYECTYCRQVQPMLDRLLTEYGGKLALAFKDAPLPMHANAQKAAEAAHCAGAQGKFWEFHDMLFARAEYSLPKFREHARALKLDGEAFDSCLDSGLNSQRVGAQLSEAQSFGVPGTPTFFLNGRLLSPDETVSIDTFRRAVEEELRSVSSRAEGAQQPTNTELGAGHAPDGKASQPQAAAAEENRQR